MLLKNIIIHENSDFLIINKLSGVSTHGEEKISGDILTDSFISEYPELKRVVEK